MNFELSEEHKAVQQAAKEFAETVLLPGVIDRDETKTFPHKEVKQMAELGFLGMFVPEEFGGAGMDQMAYVLAVTEISKVDASAGVIMSVNNSLVNWAINKYGSDYQKETYLKPLASGVKLGCFGLSEPEAGSDATSLSTTAIDQGDHFLLNGTKNWITNGGTSAYAVVFAQTDKTKGYKGISAFIVEKEYPGFTIGPKENKMGIRSSDTHSLMFQDVKVPKENQIGPDGFGFRLAMEILQGGRIGIAAQALGIAMGAYERSLEYSKVRKSFGKTISEHQAIQFKLANMATEIEASKLLLYQAATLKDQGLDHNKAGAMAKYYASEACMRITTEAVQIHGGYGYVKEYHVERMMRDAKITQIYEGTSEIHQMVIAREVLKGN